jgi:hypothetical protein
MNSVDILTQHLRCMGEIGLERVVLGDWFEGEARARFDD